MSEPSNRVVVPLAMETTSQEILARIGANQDAAGMDTVMNALKTLYEKGVTVPVIKNVQWGTVTTTITQTIVSHSSVDVAKSFIIFSGDYARGMYGGTYPVHTAIYFYNRAATSFTIRHSYSNTSNLAYQSISWQLIEFY